MAFWTKIQSVHADCQQKILSLYGEDHREFKFPIELRNAFAEIIENAVCGDTGRLEGGLDPAIPQHKEPILNFLTNLVGLLEERLRNGHSGDQFFTRHKLLNALENIKEKKETDPIGLFCHMRNRISAEINIMSQPEQLFGDMSLEKDGMMEFIHQIRKQTTFTDSVLCEIRSNEENFALNCQQKHEVEALLNDPTELRNAELMIPNYVQKLKATLAELDGCLQQKIKNQHVLLKRFEPVMLYNLNRLSDMQGKIIQEKIPRWKHEQQKMASGIKSYQFTSPPLEKIQVWCEELAELLLKHYFQLKEVQRILQSGVIAGNPEDLTFVEHRIEEVIGSLKQLLSHSFIVEEQPPSVTRTKTKFTREVVVSLLIGKWLNIHLERPTVRASIISEEEATRLHVAGDEVEIITDIMNGDSPLEWKEESKRLSATFRNMQLKDRKTTKKGTERVAEEKLCLHFSCYATFAEGLRFKVSTISLPVAVTSHSCQEALAMATMSWDYAFAKFGRELFAVPSFAAWSEIEQILNARFEEVTGRGLTRSQLDCLTKKAFSNRSTTPETITWEELCKIKLPYCNFSFWEWFHAALKVIGKEKTQLKEIWKAGLIEGFVEREAAEQLISGYQPGTFLLRFSDSIPGAISTVLTTSPDSCMSLAPYTSQVLECKNLVMEIKKIRDLKWLYQLPNCVSKDEAFGEFYISEVAKQKSSSDPNKKPYVNLQPTVPEGGESPNGSTLPKASQNQVVPKNHFAGMDQLAMPEQFPENPPNFHFSPIDYEQMQVFQMPDDIAGLLENLAAAMETSDDNFV